MMENPKAADHDILMLCQTPEDLLKLLENLAVKPEWVNIGNFGRVAAKRPDGTMRKTYAPNLYLYDEEKEALKKVLQLGYKTIYQTTPEDTPESLDKLLG
jgi:mannose/fructose/N-acetylgalactosamine-specific phosphotransferase system component IIB